MQKLDAYLSGIWAKSTAVDFSVKALLELSKAPEPEKALEEAVVRKDAGEDITAKQAKEIAQLHKEIERFHCRYISATAQRNGKGVAAGAGGEKR